MDLLFCQAHFTHVLMILRFITVGIGTHSGVLLSSIVFYLSIRIQYTSGIFLVFMNNE